MAVMEPGNSIPYKNQIKALYFLIILAKLNQPTEKKPILCKLRNWMILLERFK